MIASNDNDLAVVLLLNPCVIRRLDPIDCRLWIQTRILILFNFPLYQHISLDNDVRDIETLSALALIFVFMAKCLSILALVRLETKNYES